MSRNDALSLLQGTGQFALELEAVSRHFGALVALADINLTIKAGERRAVLGSNGAGKTTLFNAITGEFAPTTGRVRLFNEDVTDHPVQDRIRRGLRRTYQISQLFHQLSVLDSLYLACRGVNRGRCGLRRPKPTDALVHTAETLADAVHLSDQKNDLVGALSHGQQRQLEIGLALAGAPRLILFDEPAAGLSPAERRDLIEILQSLPAHLGFVLIEHDMDVALRVTDSVTMMQSGRIFKEGTAEEIENDPQVQALYLGTGDG